MDLTLPVDSIAMAAAFCCALVAGLLFAFAIVVMPGFRELGDREFLGAFRAVDGVIQGGQPVFVTVWAGSAVLPVVAVVVRLRSDGGPVPALLVAAAAVSVVAVHLPTQAVNIRLNNRPLAVEVGVSTEAGPSSCAGGSSHVDAVEPGPHRGFGRGRTAARSRPGLVTAARPRPPGEPQRWRLGPPASVSARTQSQEGDPVRRILALLALGVAAVLAPCFGAVAQARGPQGSVVDYIGSEMRASGVPGLAYAVVDGGTTSVGAHGVARAGSDRRVTPDTPFLTGSISKGFTALAVMQLVEAGDIGLDTEVSHYLDSFSGRPAGSTTVRQLLDHTSGFSTLQGNASHVDSVGGKDALARRVDRLAKVAPAHEPGERWEYSNTNYAILGRLTEVVSGQDYQAYVATHILEPLGMAHSFVADGEIHADMATGHTPWFGTRRALPDNATERGTAPQGGIVATAADLARYLQMMMNGEDDVLSAADKALMLRPASGASPFYGFGWFVGSGNGTVWHDGSSPGFESLVMMVPAEKKGVVVLVNGGSGTGFGETAQLRHGLAARALGLDYAGEGPRLFQKATFIGLVLLPVIYLISMVWAWTHRVGIRAKSGVFGLFSLWFPLITTVVAAWVMLCLVPHLIGSPFGTIRVFQPDLGLALIAAAVTGVLWAVFRLGVAYTGRSDSA